MPSTTSSSISSDLATSTVITPSTLPDLLHGVGKELADFRVMGGRNGADLGDFLVGGVTFLEFFTRSATTASTARSMPRFEIHQVRLHQRQLTWLPHG